MFLTCICLFVCLANGAFAQDIVWQKEAEEGTLLGDAFVKSGCENASGGLFVQIGASNGNGLLFETIDIWAEGDYELLIYYFTASMLQLEVFVDNESVGVIDFPEGNWCYQGRARQLSIPLSLVEGQHAVKLAVHNSTSAPLIDKLQLKSTVALEFEPQNYYLSSTQGDDDNTGLSPDNAWQSLSKINAQVLHAGDSVLFKSGDEFFGQFVISGSGTEDKPIYVGKYGEGDKPVIDGANGNGGAYLTSVYINNHEHIEIADLEICNDRLVSRYGVKDELAYGIYVLNDGDEIMNNYHFHDLTIRDIFAIATENTEFNSIKVAAIGFYSSQNNTAGKEKNIRDVLIEDCYITRTTRYGIHTGHGGGKNGIGNDSINRNINMVFRNNHFYQTGGTCIMPGRVYNCLIENNIFDYPGSDADPRMAKRGSGAWFWSSRNVISQYNKSYHVRGDGDSYGQHIDFGNRDIILQYNYSEDSEGGFAEILGDNVNSTYRFNVSVNDGFRDKKGNVIWVSDWSTNKVKSDSNYIYNNSIYLNADYTPDVSIVGKNTFIYNNIFYAAGKAKIAEEITVQMEPGTELKVANNLYYGNVNEAWIAYDSNPVKGNPGYKNPGDTSIEGYRIGIRSAAENNGLSFPEPKFPMAGNGIFKDISLYPQIDLYGNPVNIRSEVPHIGAFNGELVDDVGIDDFEMLDKDSFSVYPNPVKEQVNAMFTAIENGTIQVSVSDLQGRVLQAQPFNVHIGENKLEMPIDANIRNGLYLLCIAEENAVLCQRIVIVR